MITIKKTEEINILREGGKILASILASSAREVKPGITTIELDSLAEKLIRKAGGRPAFKNYKTSGDKTAYPASLCVSVNDEVVHGIPSDRVLRQGDIVSLDVGMEYKGLYTDTAVTVSVGAIGHKEKKIIEVAEKSLQEGIAAVKEGAFIGDIGCAIQTYVEKHSFGVVKNLVGHGVGYEPHEEPNIPNFGRKGDGEELKEGMVLAIEPMITENSARTSLADDSWTWVTQDGGLSSHFEHTVVVTKDGVEVLTR